MVTKRGSERLGWWRWCAAVACVRVPAAMAPLALVLAGHAATGSFAFGGVLAAAHAIAEAALAAPGGRLIDRMRSRGAGHVAVTTGLTALGAAAFGALAVAVVADAPAPVLLALAAAGGGLPAGVPGALRADLAELVGPERLQRALATDAVLLEVVWVVAPVLAAGLAAAWSPAVAIGTMAVAAASAAALVAAGAVRGAQPTRQRARSSRTRLLDRRAAGVLVTSAAMGYAEGSIGVALPPMLERLGSAPEVAGALLATLSAASIAGGLLYGRLHARWRLDAHRRADVLLALLAVGVIAVGQAGSVPLLALGIALIGLVVAPLNAARSYAMQQSAPPARQAEAFSLMYAAMGGGWGMSGLGLGLLLGAVGAGGALALAGALALLVAAASLVAETLSLRRAPAPVAPTR